MIHTRVKPEKGARMEEDAYSIAHTQQIGLRTVMPNIPLYRSIFDWRCNELDELIEDGDTWVTLLMRGVLEGEGGQISSTHVLDVYS